MSSSRVSSKGQVTIPLEVRRRLGLRTGDRVDFVEDGGRTVLQPGRERGNPFEKYIGAFPGFKSLEEINAWVRDMRGDDRLPE